jgi:hypothetical protein
MSVRKITTQASSAPSASSTPSVIAVTTFKQRDRWSRMVARHHLVKLMHRHVLQSLSLCAHIVDGRLVTNPTYRKLAKAARCSPRTAMRAMVVAEENRLVRKVVHSDGRVSNSFEMLLPEDVFNGVKMQVPTVTKMDVCAGSNGDTAVTVLRLKRKVEVSKEARHQEAAPRAAPSIDRPLSLPRDVTACSVLPASRTIGTRESAPVGALDVSNILHDVKQRFGLSPSQAELVRSPITNALGVMTKSYVFTHLYTAANCQDFMTSLAEATTTSS